MLLTSRFVGDDVGSNESAVLGEALWGTQRRKSAKMWSPSLLNRESGCSLDSSEPQSEGMTGQASKN